MSTTLQVNLLQKSLYEKAYADALAHASIRSERIRNYSRKFEASLPEKFRRTDLAQILQKMRQRHLLLFGDFHTLKQSQLALVRTLEAYRSQHRSRPMVIALEMFRASDQGNLDSFMRGDITEQELLILTEYETRWGFPWRNYRHVIDFAQQHGIRLVGINSEKAGRDDLRTRDRFAAQVLLRERQKNPDALIACLIGEYHLADQHLPLAIRKSAMEKQLDAKILRVVTNVDRYFFVQPEARLATPSEYLHLKDDFFCILNTSPWIKWQSYTLWEEMRQFQAGEAEDLYGESDDNFYTEETFDLDYQVASMTRHIAQFLNLLLRKSDDASFTSYLHPDESVIEHLQQKAGLTGKQTEALVTRLSQEGFYYENHTRSVLVTDITLNNLAQTAGFHLGHLFHNHEVPPRDSEWRFLLRVHAAACSTVASLILNPKRAIHGLRHWNAFIKNTHRKRLRGYARKRRESARAIVAYDSWMRKHAKEGYFHRPPLAICRADEGLSFECSHGLGVLLGHALYRQAVSEGMGPERLRKLFTMAAADRREFVTYLYRLYAELV